MAKRPDPTDYDLDPRKPTPEEDDILAGLQELDDLDLTDNSDLDQGRIQSAGVGITAGERAALDDMAALFDVSRNALMRLAVRLFIESVRSGDLDVKTYLAEPERPKKRLKIGKQP